MYCLERTEERRRTVSLHDANVSATLVLSRNMPDPVNTLRIGRINVSRGEPPSGSSAQSADQRDATEFLGDPTRLCGGPGLVHNTDCTETDIPAPSCIEGAGPLVSLAK